MIFPSCIGLALAAIAPLLADAPVTEVFSASDLPGLSRGVMLPRSGDYTLWIWGGEDRTWNVSAQANSLTLAGKPRIPLGDSTPAWHVVGRVPISAERPVKIVVADASFGSGTIQGNYPSGKSTRVEPQSAPVPALIAISTETGADFGKTLDLVRGNVESTRPVEDARRSSVRTNHEGANFHAPETAEAWRTQSKELREHLLVTLGLFPMLPKTPLNAEISGKIERDGYSIEKVALETLPGFVVSGNLYRPKGPAQKSPVVLCPHGHWEVGRVQEDVQQRCIRLAKLGFVVFLYEMVGYNDSAAFGHAFLNDRLDLWGFSLATLQTWNSLRIVDWIVTLPDVDPSRIACTGESGGGTQTFLLTALEPRIAVAAPVVMVSERFQGGCFCENASGLRIGLDNVAFASLAAPRPMILVGASGDWTSNTITKIHPAIRDVYELLGVPGLVEARQFDFPHNYNRTSREAVYAFLARKLQGNADSASTVEGDQKIEKGDDLLVFNAQHPAPSGLKTPAQLETELIGVRERQLAKLAPGEDATAWQAAKGVLKSALKIRVGIVQPSATEWLIEGRRINCEGFSIAHSNLPHGDRSEQIPVVRILPNKPTGRVVIVFHERGKAALAEGGQLSPLVKEFIDRGVEVVGFDPLFVGESFDPQKPAARRPNTAHFSTYNPSLAADRMQDLARVVAWNRSREDVRELSLYGRGQGAALTLLARPLLEGISRTVVDMDGFDYGDGSQPLDLGVFLPGVLQFGGLKTAAALTSPSPLFLIAPGAKSDSAWPTKAYALDDASGNLKIDVARPSAKAIADWIAP